MSEKAILTFQIHQEAFSFLGSETIITDSTVPSDFEQIWERFFAKGGYAPILPYAIDPKPVNVWCACRKRFFRPAQTYWRNQRFLQ